jgi:hypothetical protein
MAKDFPYFKFFSSEWLTGNIVFEELSTQGLFINICALYWQRNGDLNVKDVQRRYKSIENELKSLGSYINLKGGKITIKFLDEQLIAADHVSKVNSLNGSKGGRPKKSEGKPTALPSLSEEEAKKRQLEEELEKKRKEGEEEDLPPPDSENQFKFPVGKSQNKPTDWNELREFVKTKSQNVGLTPPMVEALTKEIVDHYADFDRVWRRADQQPILNWQKQIGTQWLTDLKIQEFKNKYLKLHPQQQVASMPKTRNN